MYYNKYKKYKQKYKELKLIGGDGEQMSCDLPDKNDIKKFSDPESSKYTIFECKNKNKLLNKQTEKMRHLKEQFDSLENTYKDYFIKSDEKIGDLKTKITGFEKIEEDNKNLKINIESLKTNIKSLNDKTIKLNDKYKKFADDDIIKKKNMSKEFKKNVYDLNKQLEEKEMIIKNLHSQIKDGIRFAVAEPKKQLVDKSQNQADLFSEDDPLELAQRIEVEKRPVLHKAKMNKEQEGTKKPETKVKDKQSPPLLSMSDPEEYGFGGEEDEQKKIEKEKIEKERQEIIEKMNVPKKHKKIDIKNLGGWSKPEQFDVPARVRVTIPIEVNADNDTSIEWTFNPTSTDIKHGYSFKKKGSTEEKIIIPWDSEDTVKLKKKEDGSHYLFSYKVKNSGTISIVFSNNYSMIRSNAISDFKFRKWSWSKWVEVPEFEVAAGKVKERGISVNKETDKEVKWEFNPSPSTTDITFGYSFQDQDNQKEIEIESIGEKLLPRPNKETSSYCGKQKESGEGQENYTCSHKVKNNGIILLKFSNEQSRWSSNNVKSFRYKYLSDYDRDKKSQQGGYYNKYLKYKNKYQILKNKINYNL
jgi:hypothetical protein